MKPPRLISYFERVIDAPDAMTRLRSFVLQLAVRGKLVEQDPCEEPAHKLLERLQAQRTPLLKGGRVRRSRTSGSADDDAELFPMPVGWTWCRLSDIGMIVGGSTPASGDPENVAPPGTGTAWLTPSDLGKRRELYVSHGSRDLTPKGLAECSAALMPRGSVLFTSRAPIGYTAIAANAITTNQGFKSVVPYLTDCNLYIALYFRAFASWIDARGSGTTFREVPARVVANLPFPLPPLAEQHRIVAKADELMAFCDRLEAAQAERERRRDRVVVASLQRLNRPAENPGRFYEDTRFHLRHLARSTTRPEHIQGLRQSILQLAVRGHLVSQDPRDEPASKFLERLMKIRFALLRDGKIVRSKPCREFDITEQPYELPASWKWAMLGEITEIGTGSTPSTTQPSFWNDGLIPWVNSGATSQALITAGDRLVTKEAIKAHRLRLYQPGTLLVALYGQGKTRGQVATLGIEATINQACAAICPLPGFEQMQPYLKVFLQKNYEDVRTLSAGGPQPNLNVQKVKEVVVPVPPLAEQLRIVAKVDELMTICDRLETQLSQAQAVRGRLLEAILHDALNSARKPTELPA